ncbi:coil containing protein [Vibrio phage 137E35-1]|nr:coil containing protein [Vibrio phage 137E35-1]CAH9015690.1 coil containing protein [Vibrio phage 230E39-1]
MIVVDPIAINDSNFESSSIAEPDTTTGEKEWVNIPFDGYSIASYVDNPTNIDKGLYSNDYFVLNRSTKRVLRFNEYFSYEADAFPSFSNYAFQCIGMSNFSSSDPVTALFYGSGAVVQLYNEGLSGYITSPNFKSYLDSSGITLNAQSLFGRKDGSNNSLYILNKVGSSTYNVVKVNIFSSSTMGVRYNRALSTSRGTPRDIQFRDGKYSILFSSASGSSISFYNESFTTELSNHPITGSNPDQPYDAFTIGASGGFKLLKESTEKIYNVDSQYNHGSTYKVGDQVIKSAIHKKYQCLIDTTQDPEQGVDAVPPTWLELGATNRWAMFDGINTYQSEAVASIDVTVRPIGVAGAINIFNMENVDQVVITSSTPDTGDSYSETYDTTGKIDLVVFDFPPYENPFIRIEFTGTNIKVGEVVVGTATRLGVLVAGAISDRIDYSRYTYDEFGNLTYVKRPIVKYITYPIRVMKIDAPGVERYLDGLQGKQAVWIGGIGDEDYLVVRGNLERSPMTYDNPSIVEYQIKVRGSI